ncbi:hypothetical protein JCM10512_4448 [Bacteroides reticulotermitis JCM 10512]|uniref:Uncharacterized protein n=1 Tax=Bacteroides reticulotermitis JCM 10512 TaxID=1445607 RepID=W4UYH8_9BACE|nr:hypothetical protein JCM10512_4448 [Bacteroides reticulotermitis JCM 10512]
MMNINHNKTNFPNPFQRRGRDEAKYMKVLLLGSGALKIGEQVSSTIPVHKRSKRSKKKE